MIKLSPKEIRLKEPSIYDYPGRASDQQRREILRHKMLMDSKFMVRGGTSVTNPYKLHQDVIIAERLELVEKYKKSILWSPKYTPWHFKNFFLYPAICVCFLMLYIRYIAVPKKMVRLKKKGYNFPDLEARGWLDGWLDDEEDDIDKALNYTDWTVKDLDNFEKMKGSVKASNDEQEGSKKLLNNEEMQKMNNVKTQNMRIKMKNKLDEIYNMRKSEGFKTV